MLLPIDQTSSGVKEKTLLQMCEHILKLDGWSEKLLNSTHVGDNAGECLKSRS